MLPLLELPVKHIFDSSNPKYKDKIVEKGFWQD